MCHADEGLKEDNPDTVLHTVLRQHHKSRRNTFTIRVPLVLQKKLLSIGEQQSTIAKDDDVYPVSDDMA